MPALTWIYISSVVIAFLSSLTSFRLDYPFHLKLFAYLLMATAAIEVSSGILIYVFHTSNNRLYNCFTLPEFWLYGYFYRLLLRRYILRKVLLIFLVIYPIFWFVTVFFVFGLNTWNSYVIIAGSFFSVLFVIMYYYNLIPSNTA